MAGTLKARALALLRSPERLVAIMLAVAAALALVMAVVAPINQKPELWRGPPDEYGHRSAARYYLHHWLPPKVGDPSALDSYSRNYGFSYLNDTDPVYFFAGKFARVLSPLVRDDLGFRLFNVALLALLAALCLRRPASWIVFAPLLLSPQVWYIFSYFNGDAFPLFLVMLLAWQVVDSSTAFNRFLDDPRPSAHLRGPLLVGALAGLLALSKTNYLPFVAFLPAAVALLRLGAPSAIVIGGATIAAAALRLGWIEASPATLRWTAAFGAVLVLALVLRDPLTRPARVRAAARLGAAALVALGVVGGRYAWDAFVHGSLEQKRLDIGTVQERLAQTEYKPSVVFIQKASNAYYGLELKARGTTLAQIFQPPWDWHARTFWSGTGTYDWLTIPSPRAYYWAMAAMYLLIGSLYVAAAVRTGTPESLAGCLGVAGFSALTLAGSIYHSWAHDFQAQGRYLFPVLGMLGFGMYLARERMSRALPVGAIAACFVLGASSFILVGLWKVPRVF